jgi:glycosyltransferase involved in cell wall biosynthesis
MPSCLATYRIITSQSAYRRGCCFPKRSEEQRLKNHTQVKVVLFARHFAEYTLRYAQALSRKCDVIVVLDAKGRRRKHYEIELERTWGLRIHTFSLGFRPSQVASLLRLIGLFRRFRPSLVHFQEVPDPLTPLLMLFVSFWRPVVLTVHDPAPHSGRDSKLPGRTMWASNLGRRVADMLVVHGAFCLEQLRVLGSNRRSIIVSSVHGVLMTEAAACCAREMTFLFFGRMETYKGLDVFTQALSLLAARGRVCSAEIAGKGQELDRLSNLLHIIPGVRVTNRFVSDLEAIDLFGRSACVVLPYKDATQSGVVAAAYGAGRPVIASAVGGIPEVVIDGYNGLLVPPTNPEALANAMEKLIVSPELLKSLTEGAKATAAGLMNWERIAAAMRDSYTGLMG